MNEKPRMDDEVGDSAARDAEMIEAARREIDAVKAADGASGSVTLQSPTSRGTTFSGPPPDSFTGYQILKEIHRGGQGVVYQAIQQSTKRKVAIKVLREGPFAGVADRARFEREVRVLSQLNHPHIVTVHDSGEAAGHYFYVMDYISGQPLDVYMASGRRSIDETLRLFAKICDAVNAAHLRGVIHRDLKPGNIRIDGEGEPHVLDFGLAKVAASDSDASIMTMTGQFVGSLPWASPEQAEGSPGKIDLRTDVYSLGVILYQMLTGKFPYEVVGNMREVMDRILAAAPTRPSALRKQVNDEVDTITLKCLAKERERRYQTAGELARDIRHYLAGEPIEAKRDSPWYVLRKMLSRYKVPAGVAAAFVVLVVGFGVMMAVLYQRATEAEANARQALGTAQEERDRAETALRELERAWRSAWLMRLDAAREINRLEWRAEIAEGKLLLQRVVPEFSCEDVELDQVLNWLGTIQPGNVVARWAVLEEAGIDRETPVTLELKGLRLEQVLERIFQTATSGRDVLGYRAEGMLLIVSTKADLDSQDWLPTDDLGFFDEREVRVAGVVDEAPSTRFRLLDQRVPEIDFDDTPAADAFQQLETAAGIKFVCQWGELGAVGITREKPTISIGLRNLRVSQVIWMLIEEIADGDEHVAWSIDRDRIIISSRQALEGWISTQPLAVAQRLVTASFEELPAVEDVVRGLRADRTLSERVRKQALWMAESFAEDPPPLNESSRRVVVVPGHHLDAYRYALRKAQMACRRAPGKSTYLDTLAIAQFRVGAYQDALTALVESEQSQTEWEKSRGRSPVDVAVRAMALHRLGRTDEAGAELERLREIVQQDRWAADAESHRFLREAEALIAGLRGNSGE